MRETHLEGFALDRYHIRDFIGEGGFGEVYRAWANDLHKDVAVKVLKPSQAAIPGTVERFAVEARKTAQLEQPNIVTIYAHGECNGWHYIAMKLLQGETLADRLTRYRGPLSASETTHIVRGVASALDHAHRRGLIHRDVKPQNIFLEHDGGVILTDFGLVKELQKTNVTVTETITGTAEYISPEQVRGVGIGPKSDIYALGHVTYEALTGRVAFPSTTGNPFPTLMAHVETALPTLHMHGTTPDVTKAVDHVLRIATAKAPEARFETAGAFATALEKALDGPGTGPDEGIPLWIKVALGVAAVSAVAIIAYLIVSRPPDLTSAQATATARALLGPAEQTMTTIASRLETATADTEGRSAAEATREAEIRQTEDAQQAAAASTAAAAAATADKAAGLAAANAAAAKLAAQKSAKETADAAAAKAAADAAAEAAAKAVTDVFFREKGTNRGGTVTLSSGTSCTAVLWNKVSGTPRDCDLNRLARGPSPVSCDVGEVEACFVNEAEVKMEFVFRFKKPDGAVESRSVTILRHGND